MLQEQLANATTQMPDVGIYHDVDFDTYKSWPAINSSSLGPARRSMLHYLKRAPLPASDAVKFGLLAHVGQLEPDTLCRRYVVMPDLTAGIVKADGSQYANPKATKEYKERVAQFEEANAGKEVVGQDWYQRMLGTLTAIRLNPRANAYFKPHCPSEVSIVWDDPATNLRCKARLDHLNTGERRITDLKTTRDAGEFEKAIGRYGYYQPGRFLSGRLRAAVRPGVRVLHCGRRK